MNFNTLRTKLVLLRNSEGKGTVGCLFSLALIAVIVIAGIRVVPVYYSVKSFEADMRTEVSRAGAHFYSDETLVKNIVDLARRNELKLKPEDVKLERMAGQIFVSLHYTTVVDFFLFERPMDFDLKASSFIGRL